MPCAHFHDSVFAKSNFQAVMLTPPQFRHKMVQKSFVNMACDPSPHHSLLNSPDKSGPPKKKKKASDLEGWPYIKCVSLLWLEEKAKFRLTCHNCCTKECHTTNFFNIYRNLLKLQIAICKIWLFYTRLSLTSFLIYTNYKTPLQKIWNLLWNELFLRPIVVSCYTNSLTPKF